MPDKSGNRTSSVPELTFPIKPSPDLTPLVPSSRQSGSDLVRQIRWSEALACRGGGLGVDYRPLLVPRNRKRSARIHDKQAGFYEVRCSPTPPGPSGIAAKFRAIRQPRIDRRNN